MKTQAQSLVQVVKSAKFVGLPSRCNRPRAQQPAVTYKDLPDQRHFAFDVVRLSGLV